MTTIAWDGKTLAVDSMVTSGGIVTSIDQKKLFTDVGQYKAVAISGSIVCMNALIEWIKNGEEGDPPKMEEYDSIMCVDKDGRMLTFWHHSSREPQNNSGITSGGNGWEIALGAMEAGANAVEAVEIACKLNIYTGGKVQSYTFEGT